MLNLVLTLLGNHRKLRPAERRKEDDDQECLAIELLVLPEQHLQLCYYRVNTARCVVLSLLFLHHAFVRLRPLARFKARLD